ncbi:MAG: hypothetical protein A3K46_00660 [Chloroflexi bacterium RBG_13_60_9]|nr:MAG: hypothetical protein A3K46_00660 [Chloroflexi bacterium RBG_13_60_9]
MEPVSKRAALECLENDWPSLAKRFMSLPAQEKEKFLDRQGFAGFADLLSHIIAWWGEALTNIQAAAKDADFKTRTYDVDRFNAEAIKAKFGKDEEAVIREFEDARKRLMEAVSALTEAQIANGEIQKQLYWMITNHCAEHKL